MTEDDRLDFIGAAAIEWFEHPKINQSYSDFFPLQMPEIFRPKQIISWAYYNQHGAEPHLRGVVYSMCEAMRKHVNAELDSPESLPMPKDVLGVRAKKFFAKGGWGVRVVLDRCVTYDVDRPPPNFWTEIDDNRYNINLDTISRQVVCPVILLSVLMK